MGDSNSYLLVDQIKAEMPEYDITLIKSPGKANDPLFVFTRACTNSLAFSFKFDGAVAYGLVCGNQVSFYELSNFFEKFKKIIGE